MRWVVIGILLAPGILSGQIDTVVGEHDEVRVMVHAPDLPADRWFEGRLVHSMEPRCTYVDLKYVTQRDGRNLVDSTTGPGDWVSARLASVIQMQARAPGETVWRKIHLPAMLRREAAACR